MTFEAPLDAKNSRIWIDGCFDFAHHGHAGAMLQARQIGRELYVGVHSDLEILRNKGPTVMNLAERIVAVEGCRWCTEPVADAPYVTDPDFMDRYGAKYAVHGDDITTDANGEDCYKVVKDLKRFVVVKRTPSISTTDLVGRMLLATKSHHIQPYTIGTLGENSVLLYRQYATDPTGLAPGAAVYVHAAAVEQLVAPGGSAAAKLARGIYYVSGTFDLFHPGHILLLKEISARAHQQQYAVVVGLVDDASANKHKGLNYPIMTLFERSLCVLQSQYIDAIVLQAPVVNTQEYLTGLLGSTVVKVFQGATPEFEQQQDFALEKLMGIFEQIASHDYDDITTEVIVARVLENRLAYEERQRKKGWKAEREKLMQVQEENSASTG